MPRSSTTPNGDRRPRKRSELAQSGASLPQVEKTVDDLRRQLDESRARLTELIARFERHSAALLATAPAATISATSFITSHPTLTPREREVLLSFLDHPNEKEVARRLGSRVQTVRNQFVTIQDKLGMSSRTELFVLLLTQRLGKG